jgi:hypothetical protein
MAGYFSDADQWNVFERQWAEVLEGYEVPYLHMKEWWNNDGIYKELKAHPKREASFFAY